MQVGDRQLDLSRFDWREFALEMARDAPVGKHAKCGRFRRQLRQHELRILEIGNRAAEGLAFAGIVDGPLYRRSEEHTSELQSLMRISYAVFCLKKKTRQIDSSTKQAYYIPYKTAIQIHVT